MRLESPLLQSTLISWREMNATSTQMEAHVEELRKYMALVQENGGKHSGYQIRLQDGTLDSRRVAIPFVSLRATS